MCWPQQTARHVCALIAHEEKAESRVCATEAFVTQSLSFAYIRNHESVV